MQIKIVVQSTASDAKWISEGECEKEGDIENGIKAALSAFRSQNPNNPPFEWKLSVGKADA
jgi:hypothetical protein